MGTTNESNKAEGVAEQIGGKIKNVAGNLIGNDQMAAEGKAKELGGQAKVEGAKAAERGQGKLDEVVGAIKQKINE